MKRLPLLFAFVLLISLALDAQKIQYNNGNIEFDDQTIETIQLYLEPQVEDLEDSFEDWIDDNYNVNLRDKKFLFFDREVMVAKEIIVPEISERKIDLRVKIDQSLEKSSTIDVFASFGYDNWITPENYPQQYEALKDIVYEFVVDYLPDYYNERIEERKEIYGDLADEIAEIEEEISDNKEEIQANRSEIEKMMNENDEMTRELRENQRKLGEAKAKVRASQERYEAILDRINKMKN